MCEKSGSIVVFNTKNVCILFQEIVYPGWMTHEKLRTTKTARFCCRLFLRCESVRFASKKLRDVKIFILTESCFLNIKPAVLYSKN